MGSVQLVVVVLAVLARWTSAGWFLLLGVLGTLRLARLVLFGPLIYAGFRAPDAAWPLLVLADVVLLITALTLADGGDNGMLIPILDDRKANSQIGELVDRIGSLTGATYVLTLAALTGWMLAA